VVQQLAQTLYKPSTELQVTWPNIIVRWLNVTSRIINTSWHIGNLTWPMSHLSGVGGNWYLNKTQRYWEHRSHSHSGTMYDRNIHILGGIPPPVQGHGQSQQMVSHWGHASIHSFCKGKMLTSYIVSHAGQHTTLSGHWGAITDTTSSLQPTCLKSKPGPNWVASQFTRTLLVTPGCHSAGGSLHVQQQSKRPEKWSSTFSWAVRYLSNPLPVHEAWSCKGHQWITS
jgi:hypothetical protein